MYIIQSELHNIITMVGVVIHTTPIKNLSGPFLSIIYFKNIISVII